MTSRIVVLGGGTGGTLTANRLRRTYRPDEVAITVVDQDDRHVYQPGLLFVPFGLTHSDDIVRPRKRQLHKGIDFVESGIDRVDIVSQLRVADRSTRAAVGEDLVGSGHDVCVTAYDFDDVCGDTDSYRRSRPPDRPEAVR